MSAAKELEVYGEPANGDYVAYLEAIERKQLAQLARAQTMLPASAAQTPGSSVASGTAPAKPLTAAERDALLARLRAAKGTAQNISVGEGVAAAIGALLVFLSLIGEGNFITLAIGAALLWGPLRRLRKLFRDLDPRRDKSLVDTSLVDTSFGKTKKSS